MKNFNSSILLSGKEGWSTATSQLSAIKPENDGSLRCAHSQVIQCVDQSMIQSENNKLHHGGYDNWLTVCWVLGHVYDEKEKRFTTLRHCLVVDLLCLRKDWGSPRMIGWIKVRGWGRDKQVLVVMENNLWRYLRWN